jgi:hypothetical protein
MTCMKGVKERNNCDLNPSSLADLTPVDIKHGHVNSGRRGFHCATLTKPVPIVQYLLTTPAQSLRVWTPSGGVTVVAVVVRNYTLYCDVTSSFSFAMVVMELRYMSGHDDALRRYLRIFSMAPRYITEFLQTVAQCLLTS